MTRPAPANDFGLVATATFDDWTSSPPLLRQFAEQSVEVQIRDLPLIAGMGGNAQLVCYVSPRTGKPMTVLLVPHRPAVDQYAEDYFYFEMAAETALAGDVDARWAELYDRCMALSRGHGDTA
ncbi:hypothetical protein Drose_05900 [Dactylosporangium roseum]|uniref:Uncharacterized protein n=1 Tax=Dactylosporangium roseum TaxID=47989 RepID=A0ABY5Z835_9ACTN|nr:hypothetical protein [Dactylosporangium roseum]UWZ37804.1 hypothetical protein Drose_05900 [Dactylosporangium roseum]